MSDRKQQVVELLKSIETGDGKPLAYINPDKYVQHNLAVGDGMAGLRVLFQSLPKGSSRVNTVRVFQESYYDLYRIQNGKIAEHWDTIEPIPPRDEWKNSNGKF